MRYAAAIAWLLLALLAGKASAQTYYPNLDDSSTYWQPICVFPSCNPGGVGTPSAYNQTWTNSSPSLDGNSMLLTETGTDYSNAMYHTSFGANDSACQFTGTYSVQLASTPPFQVFGMDMYQYINPVRLMFGSQCALAGSTAGFWSFFNQGLSPPNGTWIESSVPCPLTSGAWYTISMTVHRVPGDTSCPGGVPAEHYDSITQGLYGGTPVTYPLNLSYCSETIGYADDTGMQFDVSGSVTGGVLTAYVDEQSYSASCAAPAISAGITLLGNLRLSGGLTLSSPSSSVLCGPPAYLCSTSSTANPGVVTALFSSTASTPTSCAGQCQNSVAYDTTLNPSGTDPVTRITDGTSITSGDSVGNLTVSGGSNDRMWSANEDYVAVERSGAFALIYQLTTNGAGAVQVVNTGVPAIAVSGQFGFDPNTDAQFYSTSTTTLNQYTISSISSMPSPTAVFNVATACPWLTSPANLNGVNIPSADSNTFAFYLGTQDNGVIVVAYNRTSGCSSINFQTGQWWQFCAVGSCNSSTPATGTISTSGNNCWGAPGTSGQGIHDMVPSPGGAYALITIENFGTWNQGACSGVNSTVQFISWQYGTGNTTWADNSSSTSHGQYGSHPSVGYNTALAQYGASETSQQGNARPISNLSGGFTQFAALPDVEELHDGWQAYAVGGLDAGPWLGASGNVLATQGAGCSTSAVYCPIWPSNMAWAIFPNGTYPPGTPIRTFGHNFICSPTDGATGSATCTDGILDSFAAGNGLSVPSPKGHYLMYVSTMFHQMGNDSTAAPRSDAFVITLQ